MQSSNLRDVLILYGFSNHDQLIKSLCKNLNEQGIVADSFNVVSWIFFSINNHKRPFLLSLLTPFMIIPKIRGALIKFIGKTIITKLSRSYQIMDIHFFGSNYDKLIDLFLSQGGKVKLTIWGSDFYRADNERREIQRKYYRKVDTIHIGTLQMKNDFLQVYPECEGKIRLAKFGISQFDIIEEYQVKKDIINYKKELELAQDKIIIACGSNGSEGHQHSLIFESIQKLPFELKNKLFLVVPMTYGGSPEYKKKINEELSQLDIPFKQFVTNLSIEDVCKLRIVSDIAITIQKTDAFSAAVQEHIYSGGILIAGEWLPYNILNDSGIYYLKTGLDNLTGTIEKSIIDLQGEKQKCISNKPKMEKISSWKSTIKDWKIIYEELIS